MSSSGRQTGKGRKTPGGKESKRNKSVYGNPSNAHQVLSPDLKKFVVRILENTEMSAPAKSQALELLKQKGIKGKVPSASEKNALSVLQKTITQKARRAQINRKGKDALKLENKRNIKRRR